MEPTRENLELLEDMAKFQGSFAAIFSGLRGYVTTRNRDFLLEYEANRDINDENWSRLLRQSDQLTETQQIIFARISENRAEFLELPPDIIEILESERWREDLYLFRTETIPLADRMQELLDEMATDDQQLLEELLNEGRDELVIANQQTLISSVIALLLGGGLALLFTANITGPVRRLTSTARQIQEGNLDARADVRTGDELGVLAGTFNAMTSQIQQNLIQIQREKKRADDLLHVVIPIGVALSSEKDFNRLLESILIEARQFCNADAGVLYLRTADNQLQCMIVRNDSQQIAMGGTTQQTPPFAPLPLTPTTEEPLPQQDVAAYAALHGISVNIAQTDESDEEAPFTPSTIFDGEQNGYHTISQLTIPLKNSQEEIKGVLQLVNAQDPETGQIIPFDQNLQQMMESLSSLAVAALEAYIREQSLRQEIQELRIEIDEVKRTKQVSEIVDTELFQDLQSKARHLRNRRRRQSSDPDPDQSQET
jgi:HAMP domain-containing protein